MTLTDEQLAEIKAGVTAAEAKGHGRVEIIKDMRALLDEVERLRGDLRAVDAVLARRNAIDGIPDRVDKIIHALNTAAKAEPKRL